MINSSLLALERVIAIRDSCFRLRKRVNLLQEEALMQYLDIPSYEDLKGARVCIPGLIGVP